jgi:hypothetical protein
MNLVDFLFFLPFQIGLRSAFGDMDLLEKRDGDRNPADDLTDKLIVEILSRLPFKSVCRFKCVSRHWLHGLITSPAHRAKLPQTLTGFFRRIVNHDPSDGQDDEQDDADDQYSWVSRPSLHGIITHLDDTSDDDDDDSSDDNDDDSSDDDVDSSDEATSVPDFVSIVGAEGHQVVSPSLSFLPRDLYRSIRPKHCSSGLVVCLCWKVSPANESEYVVCNPATEQWVRLPGYGHRDRSSMPLHLAVDPASASGHFHLFAILQNHRHRYIEGVDIYSSETRSWSHHESGWAYGTMVHHHSVFLHGMLHLATPGSAIVAVDTDGSMWKVIYLLEDMYPVYASRWTFPFIGISQGRLHYVSSRSRDYYALAVWTLEDDEKWTYKYNISTPRLFAANLMRGLHYSLVAIHPERNIIFFVSRFANTFMSYDFDSGVFGVLGTLNSSSDGWSSNPYLAYVPSSRFIAS